MTGRDSGPVAIRESMLEMDDNSLQMAWYVSHYVSCLIKYGILNGNQLRFVLNDSYRTEVCLLYPPHIIAIAAIYLAFSLHLPASIFGPAIASPVPIPNSAGAEPAAPTAATTQDNQGRRTSVSPASAAIAASSSLAAAAAAGSNVSRANKATVPPAGKTDPITFLASLNVQLPIVLEAVQEMISLYSLWKSYEDAPSSSASTNAIGAGLTSNESPGERVSSDTGGATRVNLPSVGLGLSNPAAAPGAGDERVIQILARMRTNREMDLAHPANAGQTAK